MGPLIYYCRWQGFRLRLQGRDERFVWGSLIQDGTPDNPGHPFRYDLANRVLYRGDEDNQERFELDEMGVIVSPLAD